MVLQQRLSGTTYIQVVTYVICALFFIGGRYQHGTIIRKCVQANLLPFRVEKKSILLADLNASSMQLPFLFQLLKFYAILQWLANHSSTPKIKMGDRGCSQTHIYRHKPYKVCFFLIARTSDQSVKCCLVTIINAWLPYEYIVGTKNTFYKSYPSN